MGEKRGVLDLEISSGVWSGDLFEFLGAPGACVCMWVARCSSFTIQEVVMKMMPYVRALVVACMSCALGACIMAGPDDPDVDEAVGASADEEENVEETSEAVIACNGTGHWCIAKCSRTGNTQYVVGRDNELGYVCATPAEAWCQAHNKGYRTHACWGHW